MRENPNYAPGVEHELILPLSIHTGTVQPTADKHLQMPLRRNCATVQLVSSYEGSSDHHKEYHKY